MVHKNSKSSKESNCIGLDDTALMKKLKGWKLYFSTFKVLIGQNGREMKLQIKGLCLIIITYI